MSPRFVLPDKRDLSDLRLAIASFEGAWGSVDPWGNYNPSINPSQLWLMMKTTREDVSVIWEEAGIKKDGPQNAYSAIMAAKEFLFQVRFSKVKVGLLKTKWAGDVDVMFDRNMSYLGSIAGDTQSDMWHHFRDVIDFRAKLFNESVAAIRS